MQVIFKRILKILLCVMCYVSVSCTVYLAVFIVYFPNIRGENGTKSKKKSMQIFYFRLDCNKRDWPLLECCHNVTADLILLQPDSFFAIILLLHHILQYTHSWYPSILGGPPKIRGGYPHYWGYTYLNPLVSWLERILKIKVLFLVLGFEKKN